MFGRDQDACPCHAPTLWLEFNQADSVLTPDYVSALPQHSSHLYEQKQCTIDHRRALTAVGLLEHWIPEFSLDSPNAESFACRTKPWGPRQDAPLRSLIPQPSLAGHRLGCVSHRAVVPRANPTAVVRPSRTSYRRFTFNRPRSCETLETGTCED